MKILTAILMTILSSGLISAQQKIVPIIEMKVGGLLGGVQNGKYFDAKTTIAKLAAEQNYTLFLLGGAASETMKIKKPTASQDVCDDFYSLEYADDDAAYEKRHDKGGVALGEGFSWKPKPREAKPIDLNNAEYKKIVADFIRAKRITKAEAKLEQAFRVDLEGDGKEEVLLTATRVVPYEQRKENAFYDEYSVVLLRKIVGGKPRTIIIAGEFYPRSSGIYDGNTFDISSILDLNGDGKMEIVLHSEYYEGNATEVYQMLGSTPTVNRVLSVGCGV